MSKKLLNIKIEKKMLTVKLVFGRRKSNLVDMTPLLDSMAELSSVFNFGSILSTNDIPVESIKFATPSKRI
jgi:hypothetical protein